MNPMAFEAAVQMGVNANTPNELLEKVGVEGKRFCQ